MEHQVGISGGTESTTYMGAVSYLDQEGVVYNSAMKRYNINLSVTQVLNKMADYRYTDPIYSKRWRWYNPEY